MTEDDRRADETDLLDLRRRLYAPGATDADRGRYAAELARRERPARRSGAPADSDPDPVPRRPAPRRPGAVALASALALGVGIAIGAIGGLQIDRATSTRPTPSPTASSAPLAVPRPVAGAALGTAAQQQADRRAVAAALRIADETERQEAVTVVGRRYDATADFDWMRKKGCSESVGRRSASPTGLRSDLPAASAGSPPFGTHFRVRIFMARTAEWSWIASGRTEDGRTGVVALGAGGRAAGSSQSTEFDLPTATTIRSLDIRTSPTTPFIWDLDACTS